ncbi:phage virion morphogenesis protein [Rheinheimera baltica]|uniref:phage virion morphogenesis protein n=1 Tax=Rheinheimera baltica TaxID=67576 RepID=UPI0003F67780|nr:phage virion morphogenesis protein [Rheinheimera baltica]
MAGVKAVITSDIGPKLAGLIQNVEHPAPLFGVINEYLLQAHRTRFKQQVSPDGKAWQALSPRYAKTKRRNADKILTFRGFLQGTLRGQYDDKGLEFGTNSQYGAIHQFGGDIKRKASQRDLYFRQGKDGSVGNRFVKKKKSNFVQTVNVGPYTIRIPARPWLGTSKADEATILQKTQRYLQNAIATRNAL